MIKKSFNDNWNIKLFNSNYAYKPITVPYDAMIYEQRVHGAKSGKNCSWIEAYDYEFVKKVFADYSFQDKTVILEFEGVYHNAEVYVNNNLVARRPYGYTNFYVDITNELTIGKAATLKVVCINSDQPNSRWYSGTGILRPVNLYLLPKKHININGIKISTIDYKEGRVRVDIESNAPGELELKIKGKEDLVYFSTFFTYGHFSQEISIKNFVLWDEDNPYLYTLEVSYALETYKETFGIRQIEYNENGFFINGKRKMLLGACIHSDNGLLGAITDKKCELRKIKILKNAGYNAIRSAHNPLSKWTLEACDELGMFVLDEYSDCWTTKKTKYDYSLYLKDYYQEDLKDMVNKDFNHPSVIMYSTGNEVGESAAKDGIKLNKEFVKILHSLDPSRPVTCGINILYNALAKLGIGFYSDKKAETNKNKAVGSEFFNNLNTKLGAPTLEYGAKLHLCDLATKGIFSTLDVAGYNYGILRYKHDLKKYKNRLILGTETYCKDARKFFLMASKNPRIIGDFVWSGIDYLGEVGIGSQVNYKDCDNDPFFNEGWISAGAGRVDLIGDELSEAKYTKVAFEKEPIRMALLSPSMLTEKHTVSSWKFTKAIESYTFEGYENQKCMAIVFSTSYKVALYLNSKLIGTKKVNKNAISKFSFPYVPGELTCIGLDKSNNKISSFTLKTASKETNLNLIPEEDVFHTNEYIFIKIQYTDDNGIIKPINSKISVSVTGATIEALGNGCSYQKDGFHENYTLTYFGKALLIIRSISKGSATIEVKDENNHSSTLSINII